MDAEALITAVEDGNETALGRLGSERSLVAVTAAAIDRETVLETSAAAEARAVATFEEWAGDEPNQSAREAFEDATDRERAHLERVASLRDDDPVDPATDALHAHLRDLEGTLDRLGAGLVGRNLVASRTLLQVINFFVNDGDTGAADLFRDLRAETDEAAATGAALALEVAADETDRDRVTAAADRAIEVAYDEYVDRLSAMGVDPVPVC